MKLMKSFILLTVGTAIYTTVATTAMIVPFAIYENWDEVKDWYGNQKSLAHERKCSRIENKIHKLEAKLQHEGSRIVDCTECKEEAY